MGGNTLAAQRKPLLQWAVSIIIPLLLLVIPFGSGVTMDMRLFMCVTLMFILLAAFDLASVVILTIFLACGYILTGVATPTEALSAWTNTILYLLTSGVVLSKILEETGLFRRISLWIISKCGGSFNKLYIGLYIACLLIAMLSFCQAWLLSVVLAVELCRGMNLKQGKESAVLMSAVMMGTLSSSFYTFDPLYLPLLDGAIKVVDPNATVYWYDFYLYMLPYIPLSFLFMFLIMKIYKTKNWGTGGSADYIEAQLKAMGSLSTSEKKGIVALAILIVWIFTSSLHGMDILIGFGLALVFLCLPGINVAKAETIAKTNFTVVYFTAACLSIATVGTVVGFPTFIADVFVNLLGDSGPVWTTYMFVIVCGLANFVMTPLAIISSLTEPIVRIASEMGINPVSALWATMIGGDTYIMPYEMAWALTMYTFGMISMKEFIKMNALRCGLMLLFLGTVFIPWWKLLGVF